MTRDDIISLTKANRHLAPSLDEQAVVDHAHAIHDVLTMDSYDLTPHDVVRKTCGTLRYAEGMAVAAAAKKAAMTETETERVRLNKGDAPTGGASAGPSAPRAARVTTQRSFGDTLRDSLHRTDGTRPSATAQQIADRLRAMAQRLTGDAAAPSYGDVVRRLTARSYPGGAPSQSTDARMTPPSIVNQGAQQGDGLLPPASRQCTTWLPRADR